MHSNLGMLFNFSAAIVAAFVGGWLAQRFGLPTLVGYLLTGIAIGPFTPGFAGDVSTIRQLAEIGVIFLMFGVGLHFSFGELWQVRKLAIPGALGQTLLATLAGFGLSRLWGWSVPAGIVLGLCASVASTVVLLRGLMDNELLDTPHGQAAVGWLVVEDILSVLILVLLPALAPNGGSFSWGQLGLTLLKTALFAALMFLIGARLIPWMLKHVAQSGSRELFILGVLSVALGTALGASELFGVSIALGAFVAGAIVSSSPLRQQVDSDVEPFREAFAALFFVSVGMLVNPLFLWQHAGEVLAISLLVVAGKALITLLLGRVLPGPARTFQVVAIGLSQIGEFSFILGEAGVSLGLLESDQYSLVLAGALISITTNMFLYRLLPVEKIQATQAVSVEAAKTVSSQELGEEN
jgi:monovalent cation:H+ antiporter-2, CPA2 family